MIACVTDEVSCDLEAACKALAKIGISSCELRNVGTRRIGKGFTIPELSSMLNVMDQCGLRLEAISPGLWKDGWRGVKPLSALRAALVQHLAVARALKCNQVITFGFRIKPNGEIPSRKALVDFFGNAADAATSIGLCLLLENHSSCAVATTEELAHVVSSVRSPALLANWDPANDFLRTGHPAMSGEAAVHALLPYLGSVHVKDIDVNRRGVPLGSGHVGWKEVFQKLAEYGWQGRLTLEPHRKGGEESIAHDYSLLRTLSCVIPTS